MPLIRSASFNLFVEIVIRICLLSLFCYMETMPPFVRVILPSELENDCKYPRRESYVPGGALWAIVLSVPCLLSLLAWGACNDCNDALEILLAWSLALGINGVLTDTMKLIVGRPRPDFFYRCFPDGVETSDLQCTGDPSDIMEGRKSFPSGHSSCKLTVCSTSFRLRLCLRGIKKSCAYMLFLTMFYICDKFHQDLLRHSGDNFIQTLAFIILEIKVLNCVVSFCSLGMCALWVCGRLGALRGRRGSAARALACLAPLLLALCVALSRSCDYHHHWQDILVGSTLGFTVASFCYRQYYNPLSSELSGVPYVVSDTNLVRFNGKPDSPAKDLKDIESTPLLNCKKEDKWI